MRFAMGAVMLIPRALFEKTGGFANLSQSLADDYRLGKSVEKLGLRVVFATGYDLQSGAGARNGAVLLQKPYDEQSIARALRIAIATPDQRASRA